MACGPDRAAWNFSGKDDGCSGGRVFSARGTPFVAPRSRQGKRRKVPAVFLKGSGVSVILKNAARAFCRALYQESMRRLCMSKVTLVYFSPTGNTEKSLKAMARGLRAEADVVDVTTDASTDIVRFRENDRVIFGAPVYVGRIPTVARERLARFRGVQTPCLVTVTYGNRHYDDALLELADMAREQGFVVVGAAALVGRHTFGEIQVDRPDGDDLAADGEFAARAFSLAREVKDIPGNRPYREGGGGGKFRPLTSEECVHCGLCVKLCPVHAIADDCETVADTCLSCFRCIRRCPKGAKNMDTEAYRGFASAFSEKLKARRENEYYC